MPTEVETVRKRGAEDGTDSKRDAGGEAQMILVKGRLINEKQLLHVIDYSKNECKPYGCRIEYINGKEFTPGDIKSADIYAAIEAKDNLTQQSNTRVLLQTTEIKALRKELKDTEDLYMHANSENEKLRLKIEKLTINIANAPNCEFALIGHDGLCIGNEECTGDCTRCGIYYKFCESAVDDDETGCQGLKDGTGNYYRKCRTCPGWHRAPAGDPEDN